MRETSTRIQQKVARELGELILEHLRDEHTTEVMVNPDGAIWTEHLIEGIRRIGDMNASQAESFLGTAAALLHTTIHSGQPSLEGELVIDDMNLRLAGSIPPKTTGPQFTIRKPATRIFTLDDYVEQGALSPFLRDYIREAIHHRKNIIISGGTASGKTTLANAIAAEIASTTPNDRVLILEDTREIQCNVPNVVPFRTNGAEDMEALVKSSLRHRPDRVIVGEVRDGAALALLELWNTGHEGGIATIHARKTSIEGSLLRLEYLASKGQQGDHRILIGEAVDIIITIEKRGQRRLITGISEIHKFDTRKQEYEISPIQVDGTNNAQKREEK